MSNKSKHIAIANWKMNLVRSEAEELVKGIIESLDDNDLKNACVIIAPPFTSLQSVSDLIKATPIELSAQNVYLEESGAYTGEVSADMLVDVGCRWVIIGHSERRHILGETNQMINSKILLSLKKGLKVIFCIGERLEEKNEGRTLDVINEQIDIGLKNVSAEQLDDILFAYEPVWAIGTGVNAEPEDAESVHKSIKDHVSVMFNCNKEKIRVMYGGSVKSGNINSLISEPNIDGVLVGGASLEKDSFVKIIKSSGVE